MDFILYHTWGNDSFCKRYLICKRRPPKDTLSVTTPLPPSLTPPRRGRSPPGLCYQPLCTPFKDLFPLWVLDAPSCLPSGHQWVDGRFQVICQRLDRAAKDFRDLLPSLPFHRRAKLAQKQQVFLVILDPPVAQALVP